MDFFKNNGDTLASIVKIVESFPIDEQAVWLKALERRKLMVEAERLNKSVNKKKKISVLTLTAEVNKVRKEHGYKAYSI